MDFGKCASFAAPNIAQFCKGKYSIGLPENMVPIHLLFYRIFPVKQMQFGKNPHFQPHLCPVIVGCKFYPARYKYIYIHMIIYILYYILYIGIYIYIYLYIHITSHHKIQLNPIDIPFIHYHKFTWIPLKNPIEFSCFACWDPAKISPRQGDSVDMLIQHAKCATQSVVSPKNWWKHGGKMVGRWCPKWWTTYCRFVCRTCGSKMFKAK